MIKYFFIFIIAINAHSPILSTSLPLNKIVNISKPILPLSKNNHAKLEIFSQKYNNFIALINSSDQCALIRAKTEDLLPLKDLVELILQVPDFLPPYMNSDDRIFSSLLTAFTSETFEDAKDALSYTESISIKFYRALLLSGLFMGIHESNESKLDLETSIDLLEELKISDPTNGAFPFFLAAVKKAANKTSIEVDHEIALALRATKFDVFTLGVTQRLWARGLRNPNYSELTKQILHNLKMPDYTASNRIMKEYLLRNADEHSHAVSFGKLLMQRGLKSKNKEFVYWIAVEYQIGKKKLEQVIEHSPSIKDSLKGYELDYKQLSEKFDYYSEKNFLKVASDNTKPCPADALITQLHKDIDFFTSPAK